MFAAPGIVHGKRCGTEWVRNAERVAVALNEIASFDMRLKCKMGDQGCNTWLLGSIIGVGMEEGLDWEGKGG